MANYQSCKNNGNRTRIHDGITYRIRLSNFDVSHSMEIVRRNMFAGENNFMLVKRFDLVFSGDIDVYAALYCVHRSGCLFVSPDRVIAEKFRNQRQEQILKKVKNIPCCGRCRRVTPCTRSDSDHICVHHFQVRFES